MTQNISTQRVEEEKAAKNQVSFPFRSTCVADACLIRTSSECGSTAIEQLNHDETCTVNGWEGGCEYTDCGGDHVLWYNIQRDNGRVGWVKAFCMDP
ncbi:MAG: hypothetical protein ACRDQU_07010 [Pseudonocardiaceae bacterium]